MKKPLIAILTNNDDDIYCFRLELIKAFIASGFDVLISCPYGPKFDLMGDLSYRYDDPVIDRRGTNIVSDAKLLAHYFRLFKKEKPDIVLTYTAKPNVYAGMAAKVLKIPYITNVTGIGSVVNMTGFKKRIVLLLFKLSYRNATCIMFQNETNMELALKSNMVKGDYKLIPGSGVDLDRFPLQPYPNGGDGKIGEKVVFNYIGRILHDKGVDDYIEAARRITEDYPNTEFNMIGFIEPTENHYEKELADLEKEGIVHYRGSQKDVKPWIQRSHAIIHPSTYGEGMSNVLLENASSGRFIITTDNPGCMETVINEKSGYIYKGNDVEDLITKIESFLLLRNEDREEMSFCGRRHVERNFSRELVINAYIDEINKIFKSIN